MNNTFKAFETLKYFEKYDGERIKINGETIEFDILFNKYSLPHLLGLHYMYKNTKIKNQIYKIDDNGNVIKTREIYNNIINNKISDEEIYKKIENKNIDMLNSVKKRINTFLDFMQNLEKGYIVENIKK